MSLSDKDISHVFTHTEHLWPKVSGKKFFITGGTGFLGKWLLESFAWANDKLNLNAQMLVLSRDPESFKSSYPEIAQKPCIQFHKGDVKDFDFPDGNFDYIIHAAAESNSHMNRENPLMVLDTIVKGTRHVLDFAVKCNAKRFLFTSSGAVNGIVPPEISNICEDFAGAADPSLPKLVYSESKKFAELLCNIYHKQHGIETVSARCFSFIGPYLHMDTYYAIGNFIRDGLNGSTINIKGDGTAVRAYLYAADLTIWLWAMLFNGQGGQAYNVGSDESIDIEQLANRVSACFDKPIDINIAQKKNPNVLPQRYVASIDKAKNDLSLEVWIGLDEAIKRTIEFYRQDR